MSAGFEALVAHIRMLNTNAKAYLRYFEFHNQPYLKNYPMHKADLDAAKQVRTAVSTPPTTNFQERVCRGLVSGEGPHRARVSTACHGHWRSHFQSLGKDIGRWE